MSDTPISDSTPHNVADLGMLCRRLERELDAANSIIRQQQLLEEENLRLTAKIAQLYEGADEQNQRIKRLEEAGDALANNHNPFTFIDWHKAKEAKP